MNKILMDGEVYILNSNNTNIEVLGNSRIYILNNVSNINLNVKINDGFKLEIYDYNSKNFQSNIVIKQNNNSKFNYYHGFSINDNYELIYRAHLLGNNNVNSVFIHGVSNGNVNIDADAIIYDKTKNNEVMEDIKILTSNGKANVLPKLNVSSLNVNAIHKCAISNLNKDIIFYLQTKGINIKEASNLIEESYKFGVFKNEKEFINLIK